MKDSKEQYLHGLFLYEHHKNAIFRENTGEYDLEKGPLTKETEVKVIGENDHCYITRVRKTDRFMINETECITGNLVYGIGFNKKRLVRFVETQLKLF